MIHAVVDQEGRPIRFPVGHGSVTTTKPFAPRRGPRLGAGSGHDPGPARSFGGGAHTLSGSATDAAGNTASASTTFTVVATAPALTTVTEQLVDSSPAYTALKNHGQQTAVDAHVATACRFLGDPKFVDRYQAAMDELAAEGLLTPGQAATLGGLANTI